MIICGNGNFSGRPHFLSPGKWQFVAMAISHVDPISWVRPPQPPQMQLQVNWRVFWVCHPADLPWTCLEFLNCLYNKQCFILDFNDFSCSLVCLFFFCFALKCWFIFESITWGADSQTLLLFCNKSFWLAHHKKIYNKRTWTLEPPQNKSFYFANFIQSASPLAQLRPCHTWW